MSFANRNLQHRSFQNQVLNGIDFSGSDLRGCNFKNAQLVGANLMGTKIGLSPLRLVFLSTIVLLVIWEVGNAHARLIFGSLGQTPEDKAWVYVLILYGFLSLAGIVAAVAQVSRPTLSRWAEILSAAMTGALVGFLYAGSAANNNAQSAIAGAIAGAVLLFCLSVWLRATWMSLAIAAAGLINQYAAAFLIAANASAFLSTRQLLWGILLTLTSLIYVGLTLISCQHVVRSLKQSASTSFLGANLTDARFDIQIDAHLLDAG
jgi:Pentapeptide repeats (8 copies)